MIAASATGQEQWGAEFTIDDRIRKGRCPECGRWIGLVSSSSDRLTHHFPTTLEQKSSHHQERNSRIAARMNVATWIGVERREYADLKYANGSEPRHRAMLDMRNFGLDINGEWWVFITNYLRRSQLLGLDTAAGRQAFGKTIVTMLHALETAVEVHGPMPQPGVTTGEVNEWVR